MKAELPMNEISVFMKQLDCLLASSSAIEDTEGTHLFMTQRADPHQTPNLLEPRSWMYQSSEL